MARKGNTAIRDEPLVRRVQQPVQWYKGSATGRLLWFCDGCRLEVASNHIYCPWCGRKFDDEKTRDAQKGV